uniref:G-protein coupled receptors family 1 profile domain-containing protein n=1 Tax=Junco hyemalis TaxID=40217 RepID=A0A8C5IQX1_JUNHY
MAWHGMHISLLPTESFPLQGAAEEPHGPSLDSPSTDCPSTLTTARGHIPLPAQCPSMEVTTVSPSPASPTEGDDLCETDVTSVAIHSVALPICLCGLAGNGTVIGLLSLKTSNSCIFNLALTDFLLLLFAIPSALLILMEDISCSPVLPLMYMNFVFQLSVFSCYWTLYQLMCVSNERYLLNFFKLYCRCDPPLRLWWEHCQAAVISMNTIILLLFAAPMLVSSTVDFINAKRGSQQQQPKRRDIVLVITVLLTLILSLCNFLQQLGYIAVSSQVVFLLTCINSSIKPFIYFFLGRCWRPCSMESLRLSLQRVFEEQKKNTACENHATRDTGV